MNRTVYIAPNRAYLENHLGRPLNPKTETYASKPQHIAAGGVGLTVHFVGFWQRGYERPQDWATEARMRQLAGATIINAPWVQP